MYLITNKKSKTGACHKKGSMLADIDLDRYKNRPLYETKSEVKNTQSHQRRKC